MERDDIVVSLYYKNIPVNNKIEKLNEILLFLFVDFYNNNERIAGQFKILEFVSIEGGFSWSLSEKSNSVYCFLDGFKKQEALDAMYKLQDLIQKKINNGMQFAEYIEKVEVSLQGKKMFDVKPTSS